MSRLLLMAVLAAGTLPAAVIRGVVMDAASGRPIARAVVSLQPVEGTAATPAGMRTRTTGDFVFDNLPAGAYFLTAAKNGFAPFKYGQKTWRGAGSTIIVEAGSAPYLDIRLRRYPSIAGTVWDENEIGIPEMTVAAYRATRPPRLVGKATTDERGMYRIFGLLPGTYFIRTLARQVDDFGFLPTFSKETARVDEARQHDLDLDTQVTDATVRPIAGRLLTMAGRAIVYPPIPVSVTLISDMGDQTYQTDASGNFQFDHLAPGEYELEARATDSLRNEEMTAWSHLTLDRDRGDLRLQLRSTPDVTFRFTSDTGQSIVPAKVAVMARRKSLAGDGSPKLLEVHPFNGSARLAPGRWDVAAVPAANSYVSQFSARSLEGAERQRPDGWSEIVVRDRGETVSFTIAAHAGSIHGRVLGSGHDPVPGAPVFLEAWDVEKQRRLIDLRVARSDLRGQFHFEGLTPGRYRILSTFEFDDPDPATLDAANARLIDVAETRDTPLDLDLYTRP